MDAKRILMCDSCGIKYEESEITPESICDNCGEGTVHNAIIFMEMPGDLTETAQCLDDVIQAFCDEFGTEHPEAELDLEGSISYRHDGEDKTADSFRELVTAF